MDMIDTTKLQFPALKSKKETGLNRMFDEFNTTYQVQDLPGSAIFNTIDLINDEVLEAEEEAQKDDIKGFAAELTDIIYITAQRMKAHGFDINALLEEKHRSNMSKVIPLSDSVEDIEMYMAEIEERYPNAELYPVHGGYILKCKDTGKVIKPSCYSKAVITNDMIGN